MIKKNWLNKLVEKYKKLWDEEDEELKKQPKHYDNKRRKFGQEKMWLGFKQMYSLFQSCCYK